MKEATMRTGYLSFWAMLTLMLAANLPAAADDSGHWRGLAALVVTDQKTFKVDDGTDHVASVSEQDGAIHNADGKPFLDKARYQVVSVVDTGVIRGGYKTFTEADGSKVFAKYTVTEFKLPEVMSASSSCHRMLLRSADNWRHVSSVTVYRIAPLHQATGAKQFDRLEPGDIGTTARCPLWVISRHEAPKPRCPLYPQKRTSFAAAGMSALCH